MAYAPTDRPGNAVICECERPQSSFRRPCPSDLRRASKQFRCSGYNGLGFELKDWARIEANCREAEERANREREQKAERSSAVRCVVSLLAACAMMAATGTLLWFFVAGRAAPVGNVASVGQSGGITANAVQGTDTMVWGVDGEGYSKLQFGASDSDVALRWKGGEKK